MTDTYYPGWRARVDGEPAPILRANSLFRAARVDAGRHAVTFRYRPWSFRAGAALSAIAAVVVVAAMLLGMNVNGFGRD